MTTVLQIQTELDKAISLLSTASDLMESGRLVSISALHKMINSICIGINDVSNEEKEILLPRLTNLLEKLDDFSSYMANQYQYLLQNEAV